MLDRRIWMSHYLLTAVGVMLATLATFAVRRWIGPAGSLLFFPAVILPAVYWGYGPALFATLLSVVTLAYYFFPPIYSLSMGLDDVVRLAVFVAVALITASVSSGRQRAEAALRKSVADLQVANATLRKLSEWPVPVAADAAEKTREILEYASTIVGATEVMAVWEADEEPWVFVADPSKVAVVTRHRPSESARILNSIGTPMVTTAVSFSTEHLAGRVFFVGLKNARRIAPFTELIAREVGVSLDQLYLAEQIGGLAAQEERIRLGRDLHDGVLQSLTGVRLQLQDIAETLDSRQKDQLLGIERAIAAEQRELRMFIDHVRPRRADATETADVAQGLEEMRRRLGVEWKIPIAITVTPSTTSLPQTEFRALRLMVHEAVVNALKHARPSHVSVAVLAGDANQVKILVTDDGYGFPFNGRLDHDALTRSQAGPKSLRERVTALGGRMAVESSAAGSSVEIMLPIET